MPQPLGVGDVVGGRYRITRHVVTSADQDIVFQATDQVLSREVSVLLASRANAKQVATSAKELATGERHSEVEVLDLGLAEDRTFLISSLVDPNNLLDLVVPDTAPFVEPYFTDSLGSELFGRSREMQPQTYDDDAEYYARLHSGRPSGDREQRRRDRRPAFLDKVTPSHRSPTPSEPRHTQAELESALESAGDAHGLSISQEISRIDFSLRTDLEEVPAHPSADSSDDLISAVKKEFGKSAPVPVQTDAGQEVNVLPSSKDTPDGPPSAGLPGNDESTYSLAAAEDLIAEGEEVIDSPPARPVEKYDRRNFAQMTSQDPESPPRPHQSAPADPTHRGAPAQGPTSFASLIRSVGTNSPTAFPSASGKSGSEKSEKSSPSLTRWIAAGVLGILVLVAAIMMFMALSR
ncbi:hypothetical protein [Nesterenkonia natronophila]|uniref:Uncharacterized protein n=1 Tax=Nesterenkonia natronophila TaxID=2174932 RepID=A0A3A4F296_9MICC|nr:hypothetical protein [Nesterenkonia natronophila]RJN32412.1 hypothetical protein D3250_00720 [Nesterenkonia natronophila]